MYAIRSYYEGPNLIFRQIATRGGPFNEFGLGIELFPDFLDRSANDFRTLAELSSYNFV